MVLSDTALGSTASPTVVEAGGVVRVAAIYNQSIHVVDEALALGGQLWAGGSGFSTSNSWSGPITLSPGAQMWVPSGVALNLSGVIGGDRGLHEDR